LLSATALSFLQSLHDAKTSVIAKAATVYTNLFFIVCVLLSYGNLQKFV